MEKKTILFLGIGGVSMHQLALAYKNLGFTVLGYDAKKSEYTNILCENGIRITHRFNKDFLMADLCIKTGAIKEDNKFVTALKKLNIPIIDRAEALSELTKYFKTVIAVAGTHGKSTTASLIYEILRLDGKKVSCHIGADVFAPRFNVEDEFLVVEACEYNKSFLSLHPNIAVITNVEADHMESYKTMFNLRSAFLTFAKRADYRFVYNEPSTKFLNKLTNLNLVDYKNLNLAPYASHAGNIIKDKILKPQIKGEHNLKNIALAVEVCKFLKVSENNINKAINTFKGVPRRYEYLGRANKTKIYIDYAHHPTEIKAFLNTFTSEEPNSLIVFQPHTYSRTKYLINDFLSVLKDVKNLCIYKEYPAREKKTDGYSARELYLMLKAENVDVKYLASRKAVQKLVDFYPSVAFVGAGDINRVALKIIKIAKNC